MWVLFYSSKTDSLVSLEAVAVESSSNICLNLTICCVLSSRSDVSRLNYRGFYTIILEKEDELVSVATIRYFSFFFAVSLPGVICSCDDVLSSLTRVLGFFSVLFEIYPYILYLIWCSLLSGKFNSYC